MGISPGSGRPAWWPEGWMLNGPIHNSDKWKGSHRGEKRYTLYLLFGSSIETGFSIRLHTGYYVTNL